MNETEITLTPRQRQDLGEAPPTRSAPGSGTDAGMTPGKAPGKGLGGQPPRRGPGRWIAVVLVIVLLAWGWRHFMQPSATPDAAQTAQGRGGGDRGGPQPVGVAAIQPRDVHVVISALGTVTPLATVTVISQISGTLQEVGFTEGQTVKKGDFLAQIDPRPYQALKAQYEGQLAHDQGLLEQAKADQTRYQGLLKQNSIARQTAENQIYVVKQYEGTVRADQALIDAQALNIAYSHIVSPVDGRVGLRQVDAGNYITAGSSTGIAVVTQLHPISVIFSVPEDALTKIAPKMRDGGKLTAEAYDRANIKLLATGIVTVLDNQVDTTTGMVKLRATFDNKDDALFPNQFVNIRLLVDVLKDAIAAPTSAVQHGAPGDYAYVISEDGTASVRVLKLGQTDGDYVAIESGLKAGDKVVVDGADRLREGALVRIVGGGSPQAAAPTVEPAPSASDSAGPGAKRQQSHKDGADAQNGAAQ